MKKKKKSGKKMPLQDMPMKYPADSTNKADRELKKLTKKK